MELTQQQSLPVGQAQAWEALNDITLLQAAIPGCEGITPTGEHQYEVLVLAAVGPVKAKFKGKLQLENLQPPNSYTIRFEGQGGPAGQVVEPLAELAGAAAGVGAAQVLVTFAHLDQLGAAAGAVRRHHPGG